MPAPKASSGKQPRGGWLSGSLVLLTVISLLQDAASELIYPLLPLLITGVLAAPPVVLGLIEGFADATTGVTRYIAGRWSDRVGRKVFIGAGYGLAAAGKVLVAAATIWPVVLMGRTVDRFGKGIRSAPRDALIALSVPRSALGRAFGFHRAGDSLGAVIGPLLALWILAATNGDLHEALWWAVIPATASALLVIFVRDRRTPASAATPTTTMPAQRRSASPRTSLKRSPLPRKFWLVAGALFCFSMLNFSDALVLLRISDLGFSIEQVVLGYALFNTVYAVAAYPAGSLADRWPRTRVYGIGLLAFGIGYLGLGLVAGGPLTFVLFALYGLFPAFTDGVGKAWISSLVPEDHVGRAQGVFQMLTSSSLLLSGLWAGLLWNAGIGAGTLPLLVSGSVGLLGALALLVYSVSTKRSPSEH